MLDSFQIEAMLIARDMTRTAAKADRTKAHGYEAPGLRHPIYVRIGGPAGKPHAVTADPLAIHPDEAATLLARGSVPEGVRLRQASNPSTAYSAFPPRNPGKPGTTFDCIRAGVRDEQALDELLGLLGQRKETTSDSPMVSRETMARLGAEHAVASDPENAAFGPTTRRALVDARIGQGAFRKRMMRVWDSRCAVTGCAVTSVLVASHAIAWSIAQPHEQLDEYNGLLLSASIDRLFDTGLIGFSDEGVLIPKSDLSLDDLAVLGLDAHSRLRADGLSIRHLPYLRAHRARHDL